MNDHIIRASSNIYLDTYRSNRHCARYCSALSRFHQLSQQCWAVQQQMRHRRYLLWRPYARNISGTNSPTPNAHQTFPNTHPRSSPTADGPTFKLSKEYGEQLIALHHTERSPCNLFVKINKPKLSASILTTFFVLILP